MASLFFSYSHKDEDLRDQLETHLAMLKYEGLIEAWHDRRIAAGDELNDSINANLDRADVILLLVSPDFLASKYCYDVEVAHAMERHAAGEARVIPVILRHCDWHHAPFGKLLAAPKDGRPVKAWADADEAFLDVAKQVRSALPQSITTGRSGTANTTAQISRQGPRSSNLRLKKEFTEADRDEFLHKSFDYMASFFDNSLGELKARNESIKVTYRRIDTDHFTAAIYQYGKAVTRCKIFLGGMFGRGISFSYNDQADDGSCNENLRVEATDQCLYLKPFGMRSRQGESLHLSTEGAAEFYWSMLIEPLQG